MKSGKTAHGLLRVSCAIKVDCTTAAGLGFSQPGLVFAGVVDIRKRIRSSGGLAADGRVPNPRSGSGQSRMKCLDGFAVKCSFILDPWTPGLQG